MTAPLLHLLTPEGSRSTVTSKDKQAETFPSQLQADSSSSDLSEVETAKKIEDIQISSSESSIPASLIRAYGLNKRAAAPTFNSPERRDFKKAKVSKPQAEEVS